METNISNINGQTVVTITGRMDTLNSKSFEQTIQPLLQDAKPDICIECSGLEYISSSGLRIFMTILKHVKATSGKLVVTKMRPEVKDVFDMTGFSALFDIVD
jgi:serine/threonine-protein kinase RsbW